MAEKILSFKEFLSESRKASRAVIRREVKDAVSEFAWEGLTTTGYLSIQESEWLVANAAGFERLDESLLGQLRDKIKSVRDSELGQQVYAKVSKVYDRASSFTKYLAMQFQKMFDRALGYFKKKYDPVKKVLLADIKSGKVQLGNIKGNIKSDIKNLSDTIAFWLKQFQGMYTNALETVFSKELLKEALHSDARIFDALLEAEEGGGEEGGSSDKEVKGIIFKYMQKITHKLDSVPPFKWLTKVKDIATAGAGKVLTKLSELTQEMGGPGIFEFASLAALIGFMIEYKFKHLAGAGLEAGAEKLGEVVEEAFKKMLEEGVGSVLAAEGVLRLLPGVANVIRVIEIVALGIAIVETAKEVAELDLELLAKNK
jgi:hypothetical protein